MTDIPHYDALRSSEAPIASTSLAEEIAFRAQTAILNGVFPPGTRLQQDELSARWGVSRTPVREALRLLQARGLIKMVPNRGATVTLPARSDVQDAYAVRAQLEGFACELAAGSLGEGQLAVIQSADRAARRIVADWPSALGDAPEDVMVYQAIATANDSFHGAVHDAARNPRLKAVIRDLQAVFPKDYIARALGSQAEAHRTYVDEHVEITNALIGNDGRRARTLMITHIESGGTRLVSYLDDRGFWTRGRSNGA